MTLPIVTSCALIVLGLLWQKSLWFDVAIKLVLFGLGLAGLLSTLGVF